MKGMKRVAALVIAASMVLGSAFTSMAASWQQNATGWWWQNDDGTWPANEWRWLDGNNDGVAECYYFDSNGYMAANTTTPDGYQVNTDGAWVVNGAVQTQTTQPAQTTNADVMTGYNSDGLSNAVVDIMTHTAEENAKYGVVSSYTGNGPYGEATTIWYSNGLFAEYYYQGIESNNGLPYSVYAKNPSLVLRGMGESFGDAEATLSLAKAQNYNCKYVYTNGNQVFVTFEDYEVQLWPSNNLVTIHSIN